MLATRLRQALCLMVEISMPRQVDKQDWSTQSVQRDRVDELSAAAMKMAQMLANFHTHLEEAKSAVPADHRNKNLVRRHV